MEARDHAGPLGETVMPGTSPSTIPVRWGWISYRRAGWINQQGQRLYRVHFQSIDDLQGYTRMTIHLWAHRPIIALRTFCKERRSEQELLRYDWDAID